jgi:dihydrodipicolinate synthase/N-acetylneuraminate lyase
MNAGESLLDRRTLMRQASGALVASLVAPTLSSTPRAMAADSKDNATRFKQQLRGPILSIPTPFTADLAVDYCGVRRMIERARPHGIRIFSLTSGNSQYASLTHQEIQELTRVMIEAAGDSGITIASADQWETEKVVEYVQFAERAGADAVQVMRPKTEANDEDTVVAFFRRIADATGLPIVLHGEFSPSLLEKLSPTQAIVALKEDVGLEYYIRVQRHFGERYAIFEGGPEYAYLVALPYGAPASYATLGTFAPHLTKQFWDAVNRKEYEEAYRLVIKYEHPFFDRWSHPFWRASLEHFGVAPRYLRPPHTSFSDEQMKEVAMFFQGLGLS